MAVSRGDIQDPTGKRHFIAGIGIMLAFGTKDIPTPTNGRTGYAPSCLWQNPYGAVGSLLYINTGSVTSATWVVIV